MIERVRAMLHHAIHFRLNIHASVFVVVAYYPGRVMQMPGVEVGRGQFTMVSPAAPTKTYACVKRMA